MQHKLAQDLKDLLNDDHDLDEMRDQIARVLEAIYVTFQDHGLHYAEGDDAEQYMQHAELFEALVEAVRAR